MSLPAPPLLGGCQCGACRYEINAAPLFGYVCHCLECRKQTSAPFSASILVRTDVVSASGPIAVWTRANENGPPVEAHFCAQCGVRLFHHTVPRGPRVRVKIGTLDESDWFRPAAEFYTKRRFDWVAFAGEPVQCLEEATDRPALVAAWARLFPS